MENYLNSITEKLKNNLSIKNVKIIDNSHLHIGHKFYDKKKFHLKLEIDSEDLRKMPRIEAQKLIMKILIEDMKNKIHALEILIK
jgi:BolA family transcriptional regulator, general stress-responsive regulator